MLDLVFVNDDFAVSGVVVGPPFSTSDHNSVSFRLVYLVSSALKSSQSRYRFDAENLKLICDDLSFVDWSSIFYTTDLETVWSNFSSTILNSVHKFADKISVTPPIASGKSYPKSIKKLLSRKRILGRSWQSNKNNVHLGCKHREIARECRLSIINYYANIETNIVNSNKIGSFYNYANKKLSCKSGIGALRDGSGQLITNPIMQANCFNDFFASVFSVDNGITPQPKQRSVDNVSLNSIYFSTGDVLRILKRLNVKSAGGPDYLSPILLKNIAPSIASPLASMFELFFVNSFIPHIWKLSHVKPIFKKGDSSSVSNYRPISLTCTCCKIMESVIHDQLLSYLHTNNLISKNQHGFLARKSTGTNLLDCFQDWQLSIKNRKLIDIVYLDFQKAFDSLVHSKILVKLASYGIGYELLTWIQTFLTGRSQRVVIEGLLSDPIPVNSGVVQGSVLGPLIFILFINDITDCLDCSEVNPTSCSIFADDLKLYCSYDSVHNNPSLVNTIKNIEMWSCQWQLKINPDKSILLHVGNTLRDRSEYAICGKVILPSGTVRDLGILYDDNLCFYEYINDIVAKAFQRVNLLFRSFISGNASILVKAYITYVRPLLEYCTYIWSSFQLYLIQKLERVQKYFTRRLLFKSQLPYLARLDTLKLESLEIRRN